MKVLVGENIRRLRESAGKSIGELSAAIGMSRSFWLAVEKAQKEPGLSTLERIAQALDVEIRQLFEPLEPVTTFGQSPAPAKPKRRKSA